MRRIAWLIIPVAVVALLGVAIFAARAPGATTAFTLRVGDCFDIPADAQVSDIPTIACDQPHDAEVFVAADVVSPSPTGFVPYIGEAAIAQWVAASCGPNTQQAYVGAGSAASRDLVVGYFYPNADAWSQGERQVTCYLHAEGTKLTAPLGAGASSAAPS
jgi:hypothetical protein